MRFGPDRLVGRRDPLRCKSGICAGYRLRIVRCRSFPFIFRRGSYWFRSFASLLVGGSILIIQVPSDSYGSLRFYAHLVNWLRNKWLAACQVLAFPHVHADGERVEYSLASLPVFCSYSKVVLGASVRANGVAAEPDDKPDGEEERVRADGVVALRPSTIAFCMTPADARVSLAPPDQPLLARDWQIEAITEAARFMPVFLKNFFKFLCLPCPCTEFVDAGAQPSPSGGSSASWHKCPPPYRCGRGTSQSCHCPSTGRQEAFVTTQPFGTPRRATFEAHPTCYAARFRTHRAPTSRGGPCP